MGLGKAAKPRDGVVVLVLHGSRLLLLRRRRIPFITAPGIWFFVTGGRRRGERYIDAAYREVLEETDIGRDSLEPVSSIRSVRLFDPVRRDGTVWSNRLFLFRSNTGSVRLNMENSAFRWASRRQIGKRDGYTNMFVDERGFAAWLGKRVRDDAGR